MIDEEVGLMIEKSYERAKEILRSNSEKLTALADSLLQNEVIFKEDLERILGARPFVAELREPIYTQKEVVKEAPSTEAASTEAAVTDAPPLDETNEDAPEEGLPSSSEA